jgi:pimeloyl-ACP methyl ester carboxylesterase
MRTHAVCGYMAVRGGSPAAAPSLPEGIGVDIQSAFASNPKYGYNMPHPAWLNERVGILGYSQGGQIVLRATAKSDLVRAVVAEEPGFSTLSTTERANPKRGGMSRKQGTDKFLVFAVRSTRRKS